jgi:hypothetical protein
MLMPEVCIATSLTDIAEFLYIHIQNSNIYPELINHGLNLTKLIREVSIGFCCRKAPSESVLRLERDCPARFKGGQKWYQSIGLPLNYQRFALDFYFIQPPS